MAKKEIEISDPKKLLPWICGPYMAAATLTGAILLIGFTPDLLYVNYIFEALFLYLFCLSCRNRYRAYKAEPNLKITPYFLAELAVHCLFIVAASVQSALNIWISISENGLTYRHDYFFVSLIIVVSHITFFCIDYYATEKAAIVRSCNRPRTQK